MRGTISKYRIQLKAKSRRRLEAVVRRRSKSHWLVIRAQVILLSSEGKRVSEIAAALSLDRQVVHRWRKRFLLNGFDGLKDRRRSGRPGEIERRVLEKVATLIVQSPGKFGLYLRPEVRVVIPILRPAEAFVEQNGTTGASERCAWRWGGCSSGQHSRAAIERRNHVLPTARGQLLSQNGESTPRLGEKVWLSFHYETAWMICPSLGNARVDTLRLERRLGAQWILARTCRRRSVLRC